MAPEKTVLIVEDDVIMLQIYRQWLRHRLAPSGAITVQFAVTGREAEMLLQSRAFDITVMDLVLPLKSGATLIQENRARMGHLIIASAYPEHGGDALGTANMVLTKPFGENEFISALSDTLMRSCHDADKRTSGTRESYQII